MKLFDLFTRSSLAAILLAMAFMFQPGIATAQSRDENNPTPITAFPVTGNLASGTYYYEVSKSLVSAGAANAVLDVTPPDGGGSMTVTFSGRGCCPPEAYIGVTTGLADRIREATRFNIPAQEPLLVTVYISVGAKQTIGYRLNFNNGATSSSGIIVTPPSPSPSPTSSVASICTDLSAFSGFTVVDVRSTKVIKGYVLNLSPTAYVGNPRQQWIEVWDTVRLDSPRRVGFTRFTQVPARGTIPFSVTDTSPTRSPVYEVRIVYSTFNGTLADDRLTTNDDCNSGNNIYAGDGRPKQALDLEKIP